MSAFYWTTSLRAGKGEHRAVGTAWAQPARTIGRHRLGGSGAGSGAPRAMASGGWRWLRGLWAAGQPMFQGRALLFTNTLGCGVLMAAGDGARQAWEVRARPGQKLDPRRSGEKAEPASPWPQGAVALTSDLESPGPYPRAVTPGRGVGSPAGPLISASTL